MTPLPLEDASLKWQRPRLLRHQREVRSVTATDLGASRRLHLIPGGANPISVLAGPGTIAEALIRGLPIILNNSSLNRNWSTCAASLQQLSGINGILFYAMQVASSKLLLWDVKVDFGPVAAFQVHEYLRPKVPPLAWKIALHWMLNSSWILLSHCF
ncbi:hypothetical protein U9M48_004554 [Paspalum notatum var. saurae]|uniref:Uncharacterized protein n=1 Tax=Paspalum notatum var. saurae TaxID=547442 RepID=A0AAQ3SJ59_PASNO